MEQGRAGRSREGQKAEIEQKRKQEEEERKRGEEEEKILQVCRPTTLLIHFCIYKHMQV